MIDGIPVLTSERRDAARRFINLIDTFYDQGVMPHRVGRGGACGTSLLRGRRAKGIRRTASRLMEMRSEANIWPAAGRGIWRRTKE